MICKNFLEIESYKNFLNSFNLEVILFLTDYILFPQNFKIFQEFSLHVIYTDNVVIKFTYKKEYKILNSILSENKNSNFEVLGRSIEKNLEI